MVQKKFAQRLISVFLILFLMVIAGCATTGPAKLPETIAPPPQEIASSSGWWFARFRMYWPAEEQVSWHLDLLIAHKVVAPALAQYKDAIGLWRFHRRAVRDDAGHQFSFIFYASAETAYQIFNMLRANEMLSEMKSAGMIIEDRYDNTDRISRPHIEDTSDPGWPPAIQKNWPYFIMGASRMWLNLISDTIAGMPNSDRPLSIEEKAEQYKKANAAISELWQKNGQHAFLHHLSALFGYRAIIFYDRRMLKF
ncbi:MAG: hypothetical protein P8185_06565 [Deltaproteobacteria bacterium]